MATETKIGAKVEELLKAMQTQGAISSEQLWRWENMRVLHWLFIRRVILPEFGIKSDDKDMKKEFTAAWKAYCEFASDGYMFESSNAGKKFSEKGYSAKRVEVKKADTTAAPE